MWFFFLTKIWQDRANSSLPGSFPGVGGAIPPPETILKLNIRSDWCISVGYEMFVTNSQLLYDKDKRLYDFIKKEDYTMDNDFILEWDGKEIPSLDDELSDEELKQMDDDAFLDGKPGTIPNWSKQYNADK